MAELAHSLTFEFYTPKDFLKWTAWKMMRYHHAAFTLNLTICQKFWLVDI